MPSGRADGRASDRDLRPVLVDHHERVQTPAAGGHWKRRCGGEMTVVEDRDDGAEQWMWIQIFPLPFFGSHPISVFPDTLAGGTVGEGGVGKPA
jgi:hypothetical protein